VQGSGVDADLNDTGRRQGRLFYEKYKDLHFDLVACTGLVRTFQTVEHFQEQGHTIRPIPELNELSWGIIEGKEVDSHLQTMFEGITARWIKGDLHAKVEGGESPHEGWTRASVGVQKVLEALPPHGRALVCIHGRISRIIISQMLGYGMEHMHLFPHHNTALNVLVERPGGRWMAERMNDTTHLA